MRLRIRTSILLFGIRSRRMIPATRMTTMNTKTGSAKSVKNGEWKNFESERTASVLASQAPPSTVVTSTATTRDDGIGKLVSMRDTLIRSHAHCRPARFHSPEREDEDMLHGLGARLPHEIPTEAVGGEAQETRPAIPQPSTGEEAYLRRLAISRGVAPPVPAPAPAPAPVQQESASPVSSTLNIPNFATATMTLMSAQATTQSFQTPEDVHMGASTVASTVASSPAPEPLHELLLEPTSMVPQAVPAMGPPSSAQLTVEDKLKNAAAIAARLSALVKSAPPEPSTTTTETPSGPSESTIMLSHVSR